MADSESVMQQAQQVWSMLDDMADNDPRAYKKFIDKQMAERKEFLSPAEPHMCVKTWMVKPQKTTFYINFCTWKRIPEQASPEEAVKVAGSAIGQINEDKGKAAVTAVAFNEKVLAEYGRDATNKSDQDTLIQIAMDFIERQHSHIKINREYKILDRTHKGSMKMIQESLLQAFRSKDKDYEENIANMVKNFAPLATESPETLLGHLHTDDEVTSMYAKNGTLVDDIKGIKLDTKPVRKGLIEEVSSTNIMPSLPKPAYDLTHQIIDGNECLVLKIQLPGVPSVNECELDISKDDVSLLVEGRYELKLLLPSTIDDEDSTAKFIKKSSTLTLHMPVKQS
ncbi:PIH1 domain-containing protein 2-like [Dreissena polymorpha]|uniref:PIH1 domain-containing protein 2 n=1 Tax=Dreissena polymorpha TaxID=45954 RepID=A0A9D3YI16_DREPO|nr:PIH1 domain-containing protein 2-like [Dreissena polymorpha]XP_052253752.1 PIH1 domain-containing protein 2-like [Dreissena polymorpha]XP_052253753.1 PIH1 domain-containing protein 2-like [Dreissena polymorpha]KAH3699174.1 hypothetical protein DPMN_074128 [Dreissena polymorpha]